MLAGLKIDNSSQAQMISSHSQSIAELQVESRRVREKVRDMRNLQGVDTDLAMMKATLNSELLQICNAITEVNSSTASRLSNLEA